MNKRQAVVAELPRLRRYARALVGDPVAADDLVQDCIERALSRLSLFKAGTNMRSWLFTIMHNLHANAVYRRRRAPDSQPLAPGVEDGVAVPPDQNAGLVARDIDRALDQLPDEQRQVVLLVGLEEMSYKKTAEILGVPMGTVMLRLARGRERLRHLMEGGSSTVLRRRTPRSRTGSPNMGTTKPR
jgi:RNA polymerase sigma-70 factor (ECF subfamily)